MLLQLPRVPLLFAMLEKNGILKVASVGDCGLRVVRRGQLIFSTIPREHYFDCPYQLSSEAVGQTYRDATVCSINLEEDDIVVVGSDGLFDNLFDREIVSAISENKEAPNAGWLHDPFQHMLSYIPSQGNFSAPSAAKLLADLASSHSKDMNYDSPYSSEARSQGFDVPSWKKLLGQKLTGGKLDDITVIVATVVRVQQEERSDQEME